MAAAAEAAGEEEDEEEEEVADPYGAEGLSTLTRHVNPIETSPGVKKHANNPWHMELPGASLPRRRLSSNQMAKKMYERGGGG